MDTSETDGPGGGLSGARAAAGRSGAAVGPGAGADGPAAGGAGVVRDGQVVDGRYRLGELLGQGGMAEVRRAYDLRLRRPVAVKFLDAWLAAQPAPRRRFEDEARSAARLNHPAAVSVFDSGEWEGRPYLVMELLSGRTVADELSSGPLPVDRVRSIAIDVLAALAAAHAAGVLHRDIKPANLLVAPDGSVKVADFGIAKADPLLAGADETGPAPTTTGQIVGTPSYLAPERLAGHPATPASDLWSVGIVCWEALAGQRAFLSGAPLETALAVLQTELAPIRTLRPEVDTSLAEAVDVALRRDPASRWPSAQAMHDVVLAREAIAAAGAPTMPTTMPTTVLAPTAATATLATATLGTAALGPTALGTAAPATAALGATALGATSPAGLVGGLASRRRGRGGWPTAWGLAALVLLVAVAGVVAVINRGHATSSPPAPVIGSVPAAPGSAPEPPVVAPATSTTSTSVTYLPAVGPGVLRGKGKDRGGAPAGPGPTTKGGFPTTLTIPGTRPGDN